jgi:DNA (cytosine-5)-methyltransferase 1
MPKDVLIRDIGSVIDGWLQSTIPPGMTQGEYLRSTIESLIEDERQPSLFKQQNILLNNSSRLPFKFIDLFAGIGGFRSAMTSLGGECVFSNEWDKYAVKTYQAWYRDADINTLDINELAIKKEIPDHDILCAGFPCQPFSIAGVSKKNSLGRLHGFSDQKDGNLFYRILDIVKEKRPPVLFLENVKNLRSHDGGKTWLVIESCLRECEYYVFKKIIDARYWVPQHRERIFIVCFDKRIFSENIDFEFPEPKIYNQPKLDSVLSNSPDKKYMLSDKLWNYLQAYAEKHKLKGNGFGYGLFGRDDVARTMSARYYKDGSEILIKQKRWKNPRRLTPGEAQELMGFEKKYSKLFGHEDGFPQVVSDTQAYKQFGNSVVPKVVESVGKNILAVLEKHFTSTKRCLIKNDIR